MGFTTGFTARVPIPEGWESLSPTERLIWFALCVHADWRDGAGVCWPSQLRLAEVTGLTDRGIRKGLSKLREMGLIRWVRTKQSLRYTLKAEPYSAVTGTTFRSNRNDVPTNYTKNYNKNYKKEQGKIIGYTTEYLFVPAKEQSGQTEVSSHGSGTASR